MSSERVVVREIGGFSLVRELGEGGMGKVFLARQKSLDRLVALKVLQPALAQDTEFLARFHREARAAAVFQHPNVAAVIDAGQDTKNGVHYIAFEFVDGGSLEDRLKKEGRIGQEEALHIARGVALALAFAQSKGIVHRDVKPDNILLGLDGTPKLADLGLAKQSNEEAGSLTQTGIVMGTPLYMAPEQALNEGVLDIRADLYSLGLCLWRMLSGVMPFDEEGNASSLAILTKHINEDLPSVRRHAPEVSLDAAQVVAWLAAREPSDRYQTASNVAKDIDRVLAGEEPLGPYEGAVETVSMEGEDREAIEPKPSPRRVSSRRTATQSAPPRPSRSTIPAPLVGGVLLGALGIGVGLAMALSSGNSAAADVAVTPEVSAPLDPSTTEDEPEDDPGVIDEPPVETEPVEPPTETEEPVDDDPTDEVVEPPTPPERPEVEPPPTNDGEDEAYRVDVRAQQDRFWPRLVHDVPQAAQLVAGLREAFNPGRFSPDEAYATQRWLQLASSGLSFLMTDDPQERRERARVLEVLVEQIGELPDAPENARARELAYRIYNLRKFSEGFLDVLASEGDQRDQLFGALFKNEAALVFGSEQALGIKNALEIQNALERSAAIRKLMQERNSLAGAFGMFALSKAIDNWSEAGPGARKIALAAELFFGPNLERTAFGRAIHPELRDINRAVAALHQQGDDATTVSALAAAFVQAPEASKFLRARLAPVEGGPRLEARGRGLLILFPNGVRSGSSRLFLGRRLCVVEFSKKGLTIDEEFYSVEWPEDCVVQVEPLGREMRVWVWNRADGTHRSFEPEIEQDLGSDAEFTMRLGKDASKVLAVKRMAGSARTGRRERPLREPMRRFRRRGFRRQ